MRITHVAPFLLITACTIRDYYTYPPDAQIGDDAASVDGDISDPCVGGGGQIVLTTDRDGDTEIARILADGTGYQQLTSNNWDDSFPVLSPDGSKIAWFSAGTGDSRLFVMNWDGSGVQVDVSAGAASDARWSSDSSTLLFSKTGDIHRVAANGDALVNLTNAPGTDSFADWSPDGLRIVYRSGSGTDYRLRTMDADGNNAAFITPDDSTEWRTPRWSPAGTKLIAGHRDGLDDFGIWGMTPAGLGSYEIFATSNNFEVSPSGDRLAVLITDIFIVDVDTGAMTNITNDPATDDGARWNPDGTRLAFRSDRDGNFDVWTMNDDGSNPTNLTNDPGSDVPGSWGPCPPP